MNNARIEPNLEQTLPEIDFHANYFFEAQNFRAPA
jgi:hypothetical protein